MQILINSGQLFSTVPKAITDKLPTNQEYSMHGISGLFHDLLS